VAPKAALDQRAGGRDVSAIDIVDDEADGEQEKRWREL
jgi:hypothetical protein